MFISAPRIYLAWKKKRQAEKEDGKERKQFQNIGTVKQF
jgi:hypothetical protein